MKSMRFLLVLLALAVQCFPLSALAGEMPDIKAIVDKVDKLYRSTTSSARLEMVVTTPNWSRTLRMDAWSEGMDKTFIRITYPRKDEGIATLRISSEMWNYFPKINKVMKVPPSMMMSSWMGSDFTNDDLVKESSMLRDYTHSLISPEGADPGLYYVELLPKQDIPIVWGKIVLAVRKKDFIPVREEYYDEKGRKMRVMEFREITDFGGRSIPAVLVLTPLNKEGNRTVVRYDDIRFDVELDGDTFTLRNLQKR